MARWALDLTVVTRESSLRFRRLGTGPDRSADGARTGKPGYPILAPGRAFDNRYEYQICRFPSLDFLRGQGVHAVHWITDQPGGVARPDLAPYLEDLLRVGLSVELRAWPERGERRGARGER